jgi:hypothetical protein
MNTTMNQQPRNHQTLRFVTFSVLALMMSGLAGCGGVERRDDRRDYRGERRDVRQDTRDVRQDVRRGSY